MGAKLLFFLEMLRHLLSRGLSKPKIRRLYDFINHYTGLENIENKLKFESDAQKITKSRQAMGLKEAILQEVREQGIEQGIVSLTPKTGQGFKVINS
jgi:hypothetical protein